MLSALQPAGPNRWRLRRREKMRVDAVVYLNDALKEAFTEAEALKQLADGASLPGVVHRVIGMPDIHVGFGLPVGGVLGTAGEEAVVSAGAVGYDINCGVRLLGTVVPAKDLDRETLRALMAAVERRVPAGVGESTTHKDLLAPGVLEEVMVRGVPALVERGYGWPEDPEAIEEYGCVPGADPGAVSPGATARADQLATLGGGNHFLELGEVEQVFDEALARAFGLEQGRLTVMIHSGSRGFGHQVCTDYAKRMVAAAPRYGVDLPSPGLAAVPVTSPEGRGYLAAMACAVNYAFCNRHVMAHDVREAFSEVFGGPARELGLHLIYDVAHNIAKWETHFGRRTLVHRKGATRALPAGHPQNPRRYQKTGHPALIPGSMATGSYVVTGTDETEETFHSVNHGAGRVMSRTQARRAISREDFERGLGAVLLNVRNYRAVVDEAPQVYKNIDDVVETLAEINLTRKVVRIRPLAVIKGAE